MALSCTGAAPNAVPLHGRRALSTRTLCDAGQLGKIQAPFRGGNLGVWWRRLHGGWRGEGHISRLGGSISRLEAEPLGWGGTAGARGRAARPLGRVPCGALPVVSLGRGPALASVGFSLLPPSCGTGQSFSVHFSGSFICRLMQRPRLCIS